MILHHIRSRAEIPRAMRGSSSRAAPSASRAGATVRELSFFQHTMHRTLQGNTGKLYSRTKPNTLSTELDFRRPRTTDKIMLLSLKWSSRALFMPLAQQQALPAQLVMSVALDCVREAPLALNRGKVKSQTALDLVAALIRIFY